MLLEFCTGVGVYTFYLLKMTTTSLKVKLLWLPAVVTLILTTVMSVASDTGGNPYSSSVTIINDLNDSCLLHCSSEDDDFGQVTVSSKTNYYWKFHPNIFGRTVYNCEFLWGKKRQDFPVWQGSDYDERPTCCTRGPCTYKISSDGIYNAIASDSDDNTVAEEWTFYKAWSPNPAPTKS